MNNRPLSCRHLILTGVLLGAASVCAQEVPPAAPAPAPTHATIESEVRSNITSQRIGTHSVAALGLPDDYVGRFADRIIRGSFADRFRQVVALTPEDQDPEPKPGEQASPLVTPGLTIVVRKDSGSLRALEATYREGRPELRGFRAPILQNAPAILEKDGADAGLAGSPLRKISQPAVGDVRARRASEIVAQSLAKDGLLRATLYAIQELGPSTLLRPDLDPSLVLGDVGIPWDLLACFGHEPDATTAAKRIVVELARLATQNADDQTIDARLAGMKFRWRPTIKGYQVAPEDGTLDLVGLRYQLTRGTDWRGEGDGGNLDMLRDLYAKLPELSFIVSTEANNVPEFLHAAQTWKRFERMTLITEPLPVTQWAADNAKSGFAAGAQATLAPRYASRGEDGSTFVPGDTFALNGLAQIGWNIAQSPLLFQGGNLLCVRHPTTGKRLLLVGDSEILRNTAMGLSREQVIEAFKGEFGVDDVEVLPGVSFHLDYEVSVRAHDGKMLAFVNDSGSAARIILYIGAAILARNQVVPPEIAIAAQESLKSGKVIDVMEFLGGPVLGTQVEFGQFPRPLARFFSTGPADSDVGNFRLFMLALDWAAAMNMKPQDLPPDPFAAAYLLSFQRTESARSALHKRLAELGFTLVKVPGFSEESRSITYINGVHDRTRYLMPAYSGLYEPLDNAAANAFKEALSEGVSVIPIRSAESQRRAGAVHCSVGAYYSSAPVSSTP